jgi:hypothetical protein
MLKLAGELLEGQLADHIASLDAHTKNVFETLRTGHYFMSPLMTDRLPTTTQTLAADKLYALPFPILRDISIDRIAFWVSTADAGKSARIGIYNNGTNLYPGTRLNAGGEVSVGTTGQKEVVISQSLPKGLYWFVIASDGAPIIKASTGFISILGHASEIGGVFAAGWRTDFAYAALPDNFPNTNTIPQETLCCIGYRLVSLD